MAGDQTWVENYRPARKPPVISKVAENGRRIIRPLTLTKAALHPKSNNCNHLSLYVSKQEKHGADYRCLKIKKHRLFNISKFRHFVDAYLKGYISVCKMNEWSVTVNF